MENHNNSRPILDQDYENAKVNLHQHVSPPSYQTVMEWMRISEGRQVTFDFWARGNYTRRLIYQREQGIEPLLVQVSHVDEMRWAYRRLALLGLPVEFVYNGNDCSPSKVLHLCPADITFDSGWGYIGALGSTFSAKGRKWFPIIGNGHMMPEVLLNWLVEEASEDFVEGKVFIAPAENIGINPEASPEELNMLAGVTEGTPIVSDYETAKAALELEIPYLDHMDNRAFRKFMNDHEDELARFRYAFKKLLTAREPSEERLKDYIEELKYEIAELTIAAKYDGARRSVTKLGGTLATLTASVAVAVQTEPSSLLPLVGAAGVGAATVTLVDLWKQATERDKDMAKNPYFVLWKLGLSRPSEVRKKSVTNLVRMPKSSGLPLMQLDLNNAHHWLCPPTNGLMFAAVRQKE